MKKMNKNLKYISAAFTAALTLIIFSACGASILPAPGQPVAADPDPDNPNRIEISWKAVDGADIYYVYRADAEDGAYSLNGFSVTGIEVENTDGADEMYYKFIESLDAGDGGAYWYKVTAASNSDITDAGESAMSPFVKAETYSGTWSAAKELGAAGQLKLVADNSALYAVYAAASADTAINVQIYAVDAESEDDDAPMIWTPITDSPGETDGGVNNPYSVFISGGELYTAFRDAAGSATDFVSMKYYHDSGNADNPAFSWEQIGAAKFNSTSTEVVTEVSATSSGFSGTIYTGFLESTTGQLYKYNTTLSEWDERSAGNLPTNINTVSLLDFNNNLYFGYESNSPTGLYIRPYDDTEQELQDVVDATTVTTIDIDDGNVVFVSGGGSLYAVYVSDPDGTDNNSDGSFNVEQLVDNIWTPLSNSSEKPTSDDTSPYGTLAAHWFNGYLYVFYVDTSTAGGSKGWVKYYDADDGWQNAQQNGGAAITGATGLAAFQLTSSGNRLYAGWVESDKAYVKILE